jgi:hypothetical protein
MAVDRVTITRNAASAQCGNALNDGWRCECSGGTNSPLPTRINNLEDGIAVRCVSMPSCDLFNALPKADREAMLPLSVRARLAVEAGSTRDWHRYVDDVGNVTSVERFGIGSRRDRSARIRVHFPKRLCSRKR